MFRVRDAGLWEGASTFLTGIRGNNIVGNYVIPGTSDTGGLCYNLETQTWSPMPVPTPNRANFPGAIGSSPYGPGFGNPGGILRVVGSYQTEASAPYDLSYIYDGAAAPGRDHQDPCLSGEQCGRRDPVHDCPQHVRQQGGRQLRHASSRPVTPLFTTSIPAPIRPTTFPAPSAPRPMASMRQQGCRWICGDRSWQWAIGRARLYLRPEHRLPMSPTTILARA